MSQKVYECLAVDSVTKDCTNWQEVTTPAPPILSQQEALSLTLAILSFMVFVWVIKLIKRQI